MRPSHGSFDGYHVSEIAADAGPQHVVRAGLTLGKALRQAIEDRLDLLPAAGRGFGAKEGDRVMVRPQTLAGSAADGRRRRGASCQGRVGQTGWAEMIIWSGS